MSRGSSIEAGYEVPVMDKRTRRRRYEELDARLDYAATALDRSVTTPNQIRTILDSFLLAGLEEELEDQVINGNGSGENFTGVLETPGTTAVPWNTDLLTTTRKAMVPLAVGRRDAAAWVHASIEA